MSHELAKTNLGEYDIFKDEDLLSKVDLNKFCLLKQPSPRIELESLFESTIKIIDMYWICDGCGHIYWVNSGFIVNEIIQI